MLGKPYTVRCKVTNSAGITTYSRELTFTAGQSGTVAVSSTFLAKGEITAKDVNLRPSASTKSKRLCRLQKGEGVTLLGYENGLFQIEWKKEDRT